MTLPRLCAALVLTLALGSRAEVARGADVSWITQMEANGRVVRDAAGNAGDPLDILKS